MNTTAQAQTQRILALIERISNSPPNAALPQTAKEAAEIDADLRSSSEIWFSGAPDADQVAVGLKFAHAAIPANVAAKALTTAAQWTTQADAGDVSVRVVSINIQLALSHLIAALQPLNKIDHTGEMPSPPLPSASSPVGTIAAKPEPADEPTDDGLNIEVLLNMAAFHRAHERFYSQYITEGAVDLYREANRLRIVAEVWLHGKAAPLAAAVDFSDPRYQAAGCVDLNAFDAIAAIGVLFMEGEGEPSEMRLIKAKLQGSSQSKMAAGHWLSSKMDAAWVREQAVFAPGLIDGAQARFNTIAANWCASRGMLLSGRLLSFALARLQRIDFRPAAIRAQRAAAGRDLLHAAWMMVMAAQIEAHNAACLGGNDRNWTAYLDVLGLQQNAAL